MNQETEGAATARVGLKPLARQCGCGRTIPPPLKSLWPAAVFCQCGARHNFPRRETPAKVRERAREAMLRFNEKRARQSPGCSTPTRTRPGPGTRLTEAPSAKSHGSNGRGVGDSPDRKE
jgi:hypothetical protein